MLKRSPEFKKIVPIFAIVFLRNDIASVAQTTVQPQPAPQAPPQAFDPMTALGYLLAAGVATFALLPKLLEKWFGQELQSRQNNKDLHTLITKSQAELELDEKRKELESANELSNFYLESAREGRKSEKELLMLFVAKELDRAAQTNDQVYTLIENQKMIIARLDQMDKHLLVNAYNTKDIFEFLKMRERKERDDAIANSGS